MMIPRVCFAALTGVALFASARAADSSVPSGPTVKLDKVEVIDSPDYRPLETGWSVADVAGFRLLSHGQNASAARIGEDLQKVRIGLELVWSNRGLLRTPVTVIVCRDEAEFLHWGKVPADAADRLTCTLQSPYGLLLLVNGGNETIHLAVGRAYIMALLQDSGLPRWLKEGVAQIVNSTEIDKNKVSVGIVKINEQDMLSDTRLNELLFMAGEYVADNPNQAAYNVAPPMKDPQLAAQTRRGAEGAGTEFRPPSGSEPITINGREVTWRELYDFCQDEMARRQRTRTEHQADSDFISYFQETPVMDLAKIFDPAAPDDVKWRMSAWAFTHFSLYGDKKAYQPAMLKFVELLAQQPARAPIEAFREAYGVKEGKFETWLQAYAHGGNYTAPAYRLEQEVKVAPVALMPLAEAPVLQFKAAAYAATGRTAEARNVLAAGYVNPGNRTPSFVAALAEAEISTDAARAAKILEEAARQDKLDNRGRVLLAQLRLQRLQASGRLSPTDVGMVLRPLFTAFDQGDHSEQLFVLIGRTWAASSVAPKDDQLNALRLGLKYYPANKELAELLQKLAPTGPAPTSGSA